MAEVLTPKDLLESWLIGVKLRLLSHYDCAKKLDQYSRMLGIPTVIVSALASVISTANSSEFPLAQVATTCVSLLVTILAGLSTFLRYAEQAEKHKTSANAFSVLRRDIEVSLVLGDITDAILNDFKKRWNELDPNSPSIPDRVYSRHLANHRNRHADKTAVKK